MSNFLIQVAITAKSMNLGKFEGAPIAAEYSTESILDLSEYVTDAVSYFSSMVKFQSDVTSVSILVRTYRDHHTITITRDNGEVRVITNQ